MGIEPTIPLFKRANTIDASVGGATVIGAHSIRFVNSSEVLFDPALTVLSFLRTEFSEDM
jgi:hypothetical protein